MVENFYVVHAGGEPCDGNIICVLRLLYELAEGVIYFDTCYGRRCVDSACSGGLGRG